MTTAAIVPYNIENLFIAKTFHSFNNQCIGSMKTCFFCSLLKSCSNISCLMKASSSINHEVYKNSDFQKVNVFQGQCGGTAANPLLCGAVLHMGTGSCASYSTLVQLFAYGWKNKVMVHDPCTSVGDPEAPNDLLFGQLSNSCGDHLGANQLFNKRY